MRNAENLCQRCDFGHEAIATVVTEFYTWQVCLECELVALRIGLAVEPIEQPENA